MKKTNDQITQEIEGLKALKLRVHTPESLFGNNNLDAIDAQIAVLEDDMGEEEIHNRSQFEDEHEPSDDKPLWTEHERDSALEALLWRDGGNGPADAPRLIDIWDSIADPPEPVQEVEPEVVNPSGEEGAQKPGIISIQELTMIEIVEVIHKLHEQWWLDLETGARLDRDEGEIIALIHSELSEALEGDRKDMMDDKLPWRKMAEVEMGDALIRIMDYFGGMAIEACDDIDLLLPAFTTGEYIARAEYEYQGFLEERITDGMPPNGNIIAGLHQALAMHDFPKLIQGIFFFCRVNDFDLISAIEEKLYFNTQRHDHSVEGRLEEDGKRY